MRHNDYPTTLLMEPAANDEPSRYRMTPASSTVRHEERRIRTVLTEAQLTAAYDYEHDCMMFERGSHAPSAHVLEASKRIQTETLARLASTESASGAALIGFKREPEAEVWHTEAPTVPGVYVACHPDQECRPKHFAHWSGRDWTITCNTAEAAVRMRAAGALSGEETIWLLLFEADTPAPAAQIPDWRTCDQVPQHERVGLWHYKNGDGISKARPAKVLGFKTERTLYRPAAPGAVENDHYDESRYSIQA